MKKRIRTNRGKGAGIINSASEHEIQAAFFDYINHKYPFPEYPIFAIPNGGARHIVTALKMKREGVKRGVCDIFVAIPNATHYGLFLETKNLKGRLSVEQMQFLCEVAKRGYAAEVFYTLDDGIKILDNYLSTAKPKLHK